MSSGYRVLDNSKAHFVTDTVVGWLPIFKDERFRQIVIDSLNYYQQNRGLIILAYALMPSHVHTILKAADGCLLSTLIRDYKKFTSKKIIQLASSTENGTFLLKKFSEACAHLKRDQKYQVWVTGYHGIAIFSERMFTQKLDYIHNNPVKAGLVENSVDYHFSSAKNYAGMESALNVSLYYSPDL